MYMFLLYVVAYLEPEDERLLDEESTSLNDAKRYGLSLDNILRMNGVVVSHLSKLVGKPKMLFPNRSDTN